MASFLDYLLNARTTPEGGEWSGMPGLLTPQQRVDSTFNPRGDYNAPSLLESFMPSPRQQPPAQQVNPGPAPMDAFGSIPMNRAPASLPIDLAPPNPNVPSQQPGPPQAPPQGGGAFAPQQGGGGGFGDRLMMALQALGNPQAPFTYNALRQSGIPHEQALLTTVSPELAVPTFGQIGQSIMGQPQYGFIDKLRQGVKPLSGPAGGGGTLSNIDENKPIFPQLPKAQQSIVDNMLAGKMPLPSSFALKTPYWNTLLAAANEKAMENGKPFDATVWGQRFAAAKDLSPQGRSGQTISALDTVQGHIEKFSNAVEKLDNGDYPLINSARNIIAQNTGMDKERLQNLQSFQDARKAVVDEMARAYKAGHMSDKEIADWSALINSSDSKTKMRQALADFTELLNTKRGQLVGQYAGLDVPFKGENEEQNKRVTQLVHDRNADLEKSATMGMPKVGEVRKGYEFLGGDPSKPESWKKR